VYLPDGGKVEVDLSDASQKLAVEWLNPETGEAMAGETVSGGQRREFSKPFAGDAVLFIGAVDSASS